MTNIQIIVRLFGFRLKARWDWRRRGRFSNGRTWIVLLAREYRCPCCRSLCTKHEPDCDCAYALCSGSCRYWRNV